MKGKIKKRLAVKATARSKRNTVKTARRIRKLHGRNR